MAAHTVVDGDCGHGGGDGAAERHDCAYPRAERQRSAWEVGRGATRQPRRGGSVVVWLGYCRGVISGLFHPKSNCSHGVIYTALLHSFLPNGVSLVL